MSTDAVATAEAALVARLRSGDDAAYEELVRSSMPRLLSTARRLLRDEDEARDAVQAAYIRAFEALPKFRADASLATWLHRIVVNEALQRLRRKRETVDIDSLLPSFLADGHHAVMATDWSESAEAAIQRSETSEIVQAAIDKLPDAYRTVLLLRDIEEMPTEEVAAILGTTTNNVKVRLHRARQALRMLLEQQFGGQAA